LAAVVFLVVFFAGVAAGSAAGSAGAGGGAGIRRALTGSWQLGSLHSPSQVTRPGAVSTVVSWPASQRPRALTGVVGLVGTRAHWPLADNYGQVIRRITPGESELRVGKTPLAATWHEQADATKAEIDDALTKLKAARRRRRDHVHDLVDVQRIPQKEVAAAYGVSEPHLIRILADQTP
jgi:hypothetical protein